MSHLRSINACRQRNHPYRIYKLPSQQTYFKSIISPSIFSKISVSLPYKHWSIFHGSEDFWDLKPSFKDYYYVHHQRKHPCAGYSLSISLTSQGQVSGSQTDKSWNATSRMKAIQGTLLSLQKLHMASYAFTELHNPGMAEAGRALWVPLVPPASAGRPRAAPGPTSRWGWRSPRKTPHSPGSLCQDSARCRQSRGTPEMSSAPALISGHFSMPQRSCEILHASHATFLRQLQSELQNSLQTLLQLAPIAPCSKLTVSANSPYCGVSKCRPGVQESRGGSWATRCPRLPSSCCPWLHTDFSRSEKG